MPSLSQAQWVHEAILNLVNTSSSDAICSLDIPSVQGDNLSQQKPWIPQVDALIDATYQSIQSSPHRAVPQASLVLYAELCVLRSLADMAFALGTPYEDRGETDKFWEAAVARLDKAIIVSGAQGVEDLTQELIARIQEEHLRTTPPTPYNQPHDSERKQTTGATTAQGSSLPTIPRLSSPPSFMSFLTTHSNSPFILPGYISDWPAFSDESHLWASREYLLRVAGRGRLVPVEIGGDYRMTNWTQALMSWDVFLDKIGWGSGKPEEEIVYLAQHNLLTQFPALREDIIVPDFVYAAPDPPASFPSYTPPGNEDRLIINAWLGPRGTVSPAHTDPYFNCYAQVVGRKTVWLVSPEYQEEMYPHDSSEGMANTSRVDVFAPSNSAFPLFEQKVVPNALIATLEPGDLLFFPPGWWHAMRSEEPSFSVSMWF